MPENETNNNSLVPIHNTGLIKVGNIIKITDKIISESSFEVYKSWWEELDKEWKSIFLLQLGLFEEYFTDNLMDRIINLEFLSCSIIEKKDNIYISHTPQIKELLPLLKLCNLKRLSCCNKSIIDITPLKQLNKLEELWLSWCPINDISPISELTNLKYLYLKGTNIKTIKPLYNLKSLKFISLQGLNIPLSEVENLKNINPNCNIL